MKKLLLTIGLVLILSVFGYLFTKNFVFAFFMGILGTVILK